jgi:hypothetical protein
MKPPALPGEAASKFLTRINPSRARDDVVLRPQLESNREVWSSPAFPQ